MTDQVKELLQFLHDKSPQVRQIALSNLLGHTPTGSPSRKIFFEGGGTRLSKGGSENESIRDLKVLCRDQLTIAHDAFRALINLTDGPHLSVALSEANFLSFLVSYIINPPSILADLASMLLSNLTSQPSICAALIGLTISVIPTERNPISFYPPASLSATSPAPSSGLGSNEYEVLALPLLLQAFVRAANIDSPSASRTHKGDLHFIASVFANISMATTGRAFLLTPRPVDPLANADSTPTDLQYPLSELIVFTEHPDTIRRGGVASTIKHCAFNVAAHKALLLPESELAAVPPSTVMAPAINLLPYILLPLAGPEEFDLEDQEKLPTSLQFLPDTKRREPDEVLRLVHVETLTLFCTTRAGRDYLRQHGVYEVVRALHLAERVEKISEHVERLVTLLKGEEKPLDESGDGWRHDSLDPEAQASEVQPDAAIVAVPSDEDEDEDDKIIEYWCTSTGRKQAKMAAPSLTNRYRPQQ